MLAQLASDKIVANQNGVVAPNQLGVSNKP